MRSHPKDQKKELRVKSERVSRNQQADNQQQEKIRMNKPLQIMKAIQRSQSIAERNELLRIQKEARITFRKDQASMQQLDKIALKKKLSIMKVQQKSQRITLMQRRESIQNSERKALRDHLTSMESRQQQQRSEISRSQAYMRKKQNYEKIAMKQQQVKIGETQQQERGLLKAKLKRQWNLLIAKQIEEQKFLCIHQQTLQIQKKEEQISLWLSKLKIDSKHKKEQLQEEIEQLRSLKNSEQAVSLQKLLKSNIKPNIKQRKREKKLLQQFKSFQQQNADGQPDDYRTEAEKNVFQKQRLQNIHHYLDESPNQGEYFE